MNSLTRNKNIIAACEEYVESKAGTKRKRDLARKYGIPYSTLTRWIRKVLSSEPKEEGTVSNVEDGDDFLLHMLRNS